MNVYDAIKTRRTIRRFQQIEIPLPVLEKMVDGARLAPSGGNLQPWEFILVRDPDIRGEVFSCLAWAAYLAPDGTPPDGKRPVAYIVALQNTNIKKTTPSPDISAAIQNILLLATEEGLGGCWIGSVKRERLMQVLNVPETYHVDSVIALGYPDERSCVEPYRDHPRYWRDEEGVLHVPKKRLREVLHRERFGGT